MYRTNWFTQLHGSDTSGKSSVVSAITTTSLAVMLPIPSKKIEHSGLTYVHKRFTFKNYKYIHNFLYSTCCLVDSLYTSICGDLWQLIVLTSASSTLANSHLPMEVIFFLHPSQSNQTELLVNCPQPFPIWRLPNMSFLWRSGHFTQFLAKKIYENYLHSMRDGVCERDFCIWIWIFYAILSKNYFCQLNSTPLPWLVGVSEQEFYVWILIFCSIPRKNSLEGTSPTPALLQQRVEVWQKWRFVCTSGHSMHFLWK